MQPEALAANLPFQTTSDDLLSWFGEYGTMTRAQVATDRETSRSSGFGFVEISNGGDEAIAAPNGSEVGGRSLKVNEAKLKEERPRSGGGSGSSRAPTGSGRHW
jgi:RNA recognition motif-containing protein